MAVTHVKTVTVSPQNDAYGWTKSGDGNGNWITITQQGSTDVWDFEVVDNTTASARTAICTVTHTNGTTTDSFTIEQYGTGGAPSSNPPPATTLQQTTQFIDASSLTGTFSTGFTLNATFSNNGGGSNNATAMGFEWGLDQNNLSDSWNSSAINGNSTINHSVAGLTASTTYYARAFVTTSLGTQYGTILTTTTSAPALAFTSFYSSLTQQGAANSEVDEAPFLKRIYFNIEASQAIAGYKIGIVSLSKMSAPGQIEDFNVGNSSRFFNAGANSAITDLFDFEFGWNGASPDNVAESWLAIKDDETTEGDETYRLTISPDYTDTNGNVLGQHGLSTTLDFIIKDNSIYTATIIGSGISPYTLFGSPTVTTSGNSTLSTYSFDNSNGSYGPAISVLLDAFGNDDPTLHSSSTSTANTFYWSLNPNGSTNDTPSINGNGTSALVHNTAVDTNSVSGTGTGFLTANHARITWDDGRGAGGSNPPPPSN
jgi:hypothetical protein